MLHFNSERDSSIIHRPLVKSVKTWYGERIELHSPYRNKERFRQAVLNMSPQERNI